ncbi:MAG: enolase C-terminal domain-like protein [Gemmatimonadales bacterium]
MTIGRARLFEVALPLKQPFRISGGTLDVRRSLIVVLEDDEGNRGYGESAPFDLPFYSAETVASARELLMGKLLPQLLTESFTDSSGVLAALTDGVVGNRMAIAGAETAWWDLRAAREGKTLGELTTERLRDLNVQDLWLERSSTIECGVALGIPNGNDGTLLQEWVKEAVGRGYRRIKLKVRPGWDVEPVEIARRALRDAGVDLPVTVDANTAFTLDEHMSILRDLDLLGLLYVEQPLAADALWDMRVLQAQLGTPVCLDESLTSDRVARQVLEMDGPKVWNIKIQRLGGLEEACRVYARAVAGGVRVWGGTMPETGVGAQAMLALGCHAGFVFPSDLEPSDRWYPAGTDLIELAMSGDGRMDVPGRRIVPAEGTDWKLLCDLQ